MTAIEMNVGRWKKRIGLGVTLGALAGLSACAPAFGPYVTQTDPSSPLAARVEGLARDHRGYPDWNDFPRVTTPPPSDAAIGAEIAGLRQEADQLGRSIEALTWEVEDPAALGASIHNRMAGADLSPATAQTVAEMEAFARRLRERSTPPPPLN